MKLTYEQVIAEQEEWGPIILLLFRGKVPDASKKAKQIMAAVVEWAGWDSEEFYQTVTAKFMSSRRVRELLNNQSMAR